MRKITPKTEINLSLYQYQVLIDQCSQTLMFTHVHNIIVILDHYDISYSIGLCGYLNLIKQLSSAT